jgi:hypothetical protein
MIGPTNETLEVFCEAKGDKLLGQRRRVLSLAIYTLKYLLRRPRTISRARSVKQRQFEATART